MIAVGLNTTVTVQLAPTAKFALQVPPAREKVVDPEKVKLPLVRARVPVLVMVMAMGALGEAIDWLPKAKVLGDTLNDAVPTDDPNSIAPGSKWPLAVNDSPGSGLRLP